MTEMMAPVQCTCCGASPHEAWCLTLNPGDIPERSLTQREHAKLDEMIRELPERVRQDLYEDLESCEPDTDLLLAMAVTLKVSKETGLDGEELYSSIEAYMIQRSWL